MDRGTLSVIAALGALLNGGLYIVLVFIAALLMHRAGAAELAIAAYRRSFFAAPHPVKIASARAGNVIGGGDWAADRIVPDCIRALERGLPVAVRNPHATRPWQHVLEPLSGYLWLAARLAALPDNRSPLCGPFNFGPGHDANRSVGELVTELLKHWPGCWEDKSDPGALHEAVFLQLSTDKASALLGWSAAWDFASAVRETADWYRANRNGLACAPAVTRAQIDAYGAAAKKAGLGWSQEP